MSDEVVQGQGTFEVVAAWSILERLYLRPVEKINVGHWANLLVRVVGCLLASIGNIDVGKQVIIQSLLLHYTTLHYTSLHFTKLHYTTLG
jgi:hypothetical protein